MDFNEKTEAVLAEGRRQRGEYDPEPGSVPYRLYQDYVKRGGYVPPQENFCHFWRVVVFWAPLRWVTDHTVKTEGFKSFMRTKVGGFFRVLGRVLGFPFRLVGKGIDALSNKFGEKRMENIGFGFLMFVLAAMFLTLVVGTSLTIHWWVGPLIVAGMAATVGLILGLSHFLDKVAENEAARRRAEWDAKWEAIHNGTYVEPAPKQPGRVKRFFRGIKDFIVLVAQVVRVKKWKICPLVNIDPQA